MFLCLIPNTVLGASGKLKFTFEEFQESSVPLFKGSYKDIITRYGLGLMSYIPQDEIWNLKVQAFSEGEWRRIMGNNLCVGYGIDNNALTDTIYNKVIWIGIVINGPNCYSKIKGLNWEGQWVYNQDSLFNTLIRFIFIQILTDLGIKDKMYPYFCKDFCLEKPQ